MAYLVRIDRVLPKVVWRVAIDEHMPRASSVIALLRKAAGHLIAHYETDGRARQDPPDVASLFVRHARGPRA
jgi:hypothetical protein